MSPLCKLVRQIPAHMSEIITKSSNCNSSCLAKELENNYNYNILGKYLFFILIFFPLKKQICTLNANHQNITEQLA
jgi:hypothetical protein